MFATLSRLVTTAFIVILVIVPAASAKDKVKPTDFVATSASGEGIAPGAPDAVREKVKKVLEGKDQGYVPGSQFDLAGSTVGPQQIARTNWIGCATAWARRSLNHFLGYNLWHYYQQVSWCSNGFSIYSWSRDRWAEVNFPGWAFDGHIGSSLGGTTTQKQAFTQGAFHFCAGFCSYYYPWVSQTVTVDGGHYYSTGG